MDSKYSENELFKMKNDFMGYRACPRCGNTLERKFIDGRTRLVCPNGDCRYIYYHNPIPAAGAIVIQNNEILLVKRAVAPKIGWWCIPAGFMEWDEHPSETAVREVREETGLDIKLKSIFEIYSGNDDPRMNAVLILYLGDSTGGELKPSDDAQDVGFFSFDNLPDQIAFESHNRAIADYKKKYLSD